MTVAREIMDKTRGDTDGEKMANLLGDFVNSGGNRAFDEFAKGILRQHRTLQQMIFTCFIKCIKAWAEQKTLGWFDARNEFTVNISTEIVEKVEDVREYTRAPLI